MVGLARGPEETLLFYPMFTDKADTLLHKRRDQTLGATLGFVQHGLFQVLPKDGCTDMTRDLPILNVLNIIGNLHNNYKVG